MMKTYSLIVWVFFSTLMYGQSCFDAYDLMFENEAENLTYEEFHQRELKFLKDLNGCSAIDFSRTSLEGEDIILSSLKNKVVVLNFWFTTCIPCLKEIPEFNKLTELYDPEEVVFIGLAREEEEKLHAFFKRFGEYKFQIIPTSFDIATSYKVVGWPQTMVIDKTGKIHQSWAGRNESVIQLTKEIEHAIQACLLQ